MSENCPVCNTPWTETQLITSSIKHCTKCNEKASVIMAKHKKSQEKVTYDSGWKREYMAQGLRPSSGKIVYAGTPKLDPNCPVAQKEEARSIREEMDYLYKKCQESKL